MASANLWLTLYKAYSICLFVADILLSTMFLKFTYIVTYEKISFLFESWIIFHCMYLPHTTVYPFIHWWMFVLVPPLDNCIQCCYEHECANIWSFLFFNRRYPNGWRRKWQPTPVFLPGKFLGQRNLAGCSPQGRKESATTEHINTSQWYFIVVLTYTFLMRSNVERL